eukprot:CAMPEP_0203763032 /NCGR_PEP_ID=MMETSP0098-20131031/15755_1 /ASSEMBLY_ACC=CAM_ASM_000208 /TAXON_ID=96639 /ORGANISM=" , Strain NY0313808BC1" /LENGTH=287 /DNA_ID=CAMNT_0050657635 /DNA_START=38 /DNA_END=898 /DNA_ORIENTATION=-
MKASGASKRLVSTSEEDDDSSAPRIKRKSSKNASKLKRKKNKLIAGIWNDCKSDRTRSVKLKACLYIWLVALGLSILSLMGVFGNNTSGSEGLMGRVRSNFAVDEAAIEKVSDVKSKAETDAPEGVPEMQGYEVKKSNKLNRAFEKELACKEVECQESCNKKVKANCAAKKACMSDRQKICKRRCLKARCEERCKDEPKYGYVEREQKMDKCKEGCQGSTAQHNKCIKKCHSEFKPCKSRCHEISVKFTCENKKLELSALVAEAPVVETHKETPKKPALRVPESNGD